MQKWIKYFFGCVLALIGFSTAAQSVAKPMKVAVFAPVYLDAAFTGSVYKLGNNNLPKNILPGLDFYNGICLAIDSLNTEQNALTVLFYDTKNVSQPLSEIIRSADIQDISLVIASFNSRNEIQLLADFAKEKKVPLISMTYPNDGNITNNPFFTLVNPTLKTHIEGIYKFLQRNHPTETIYYFKKAGAAEDMISNLFADLNKRTPALPLKIKQIELSDSIQSADVFASMDSSSINIVLCGSLNESFGVNLVKTITANKSYKTMIIGMPTWDAIKDIGKDAELIYTTPYNYSRSDKTGQYIETTYRNKYAGRPSDMVHKGFESLYHFGKLLIQYKYDLIYHLSDKSFKLFNEFDFQPVRSKTNGSTDYLENKKIYFVRKLNGQIKSIN
ncbi:MAG: ABC transporter substrate-binding protein [Sphingobacteriia bacterium]|nr:MAG: ABC transporter substrate-binding protein [Sphingobacteriia bacterium]